MFRTQNQAILDMVDCCSSIFFFYSFEQCEKLDLYHFSSEQKITSHSKSKSFTVSACSKYSLAIRIAVRDQNGKKKNQFQYISDSAGLKIPRHSYHPFTSTRSLNAWKHSCVCFLYPEREWNGEH